MRRSQKIRTDCLSRRPSRATQSEAEREVRIADIRRIKVTLTGLSYEHIAVVG